MGRTVNCLNFDSAIVLDVCSYGLFLGKTERKGLANASH